MKNYLKPDNIQNMNQISVQVLAHVGDAVYELMVCTWLCTHGTTSVKKLHKHTVENVCAKAQALAAERILPILSDDEISVYKRGRNIHTSNIPKNATQAEYHAATALETLFGYLYLNGDIERLNELFVIVIS